MASRTSVRDSWRASNPSAARTAMPSPKLHTANVRGFLNKAPSPSPSAQRPAINKSICSGFKLPARVSDSRVLAEKTQTLSQRGLKVRFGWQGDDFQSIKSRRAAVGAKVGPCCGWGESEDGAADIHTKGVGKCGCGQDAKGQAGLALPSEGDAGVIGSGRSNAQGRRIRNLVGKIAFDSQ